MARKRGRPTKFTPENRKKIIEAIALGAPAELAPMSAGVHYATFREWVVRGEEEKYGAFHDFAEEVKVAEGNAVKRWLAIIEKAAQENNWTAAAWKLERRYPRLFGRVHIDVNTEHTEKMEHHLIIDLRRPDALEHYNRLLEGIVDDRPQLAGGNGEAGQSRSVAGLPPSALSE